MKIFRIISLALIFAASVYVTFFMKPKLTEGRPAAIATYTINAATSDNVYQQQVVNGWAAKDLLEVISSQLDNEDPRNRILLFLAVCAVCVIGVSAPHSSTREN
jgi:hypothetical protein